MQHTILMAEDDKDIIKFLKLYLENSGYRVLTADNGISAFEIICKEDIDLAILDIMMPEMDGYELTKKIREIKDIPILILSAKNQDVDKILGLNIGADDYITKPFNPLEVVARVQSNLRRFYKLNGGRNEENQENKLISAGELVLDIEKLTLHKNGEEIIITPNEYKILSLLMKSPGRVFTKSQICEAINGEFYDNYEKAITVHISHIRDKIGEYTRNPRYIKNIRGVGYKFEK